MTGYQPDLKGPYVLADIDTAYWHAETPFGGQADSPESDSAQTAVWVQPCDLPGYAADLTVDRTAVRVDLTAAAARHLARQLWAAAARGDTRHPDDEPPDPEPVRVRWDGLDLAAIQAATARVPRVNGRPAVTIDAGWDLTVAGVPLAPGDEIEVTASGEVTFHLAAGGRRCSQCYREIADPDRDHKLRCGRRGQPGEVTSRQDQE